jgi:hypothetical protein
MSATVNIVQTDQITTESIIFNISDVNEISFIHPANPPAEGEEGPASIRGTIEILYINGERRNIDTANPTVFRIAEEDEIIVETSAAQQFEKEYLSLLSKGFAVSGEKGSQP